MKIEFDARSINENFARTSVAAFAAQWDPSIAVISDIKTVVSEAVTNSIVHGYAEQEDKSKCPIYIVCKLNENGVINIKIKDKGRGIEDVPTAMQPLYTTDEGGERSGMGFTIMQSFTDRIKVSSKIGKGTTVILEKRLTGR
ncbi:MAG: anti-sigma F factor [Ruminococcaceae bacterium]|nr:anti-sigma F factor [Oscillospiraceae bacterium]